MDTIKIDSLNTKIIAHRGLGGIELENTNSAFVAAGNRSYYGIETDVHRTSDGKYVIIHDDDTKRVSYEDIPVEGSTFDKLRSLKMKPKNGSDRADLVIPTLREYIQTCKRYNKIAVLELKNEFPFEDIWKICDEIVDEGYLDKVIFISFFFDNLVNLRKIYPKHTVQFLTMKYTDEMVQSLVEHKFDLDILYTELTKERVEDLHSKGIKVNCWTCDNKEEAEKLCRWNVDFLTTNILE